MAAQCPRCGNAYEADERFCSQCGAPIAPPSAVGSSVTLPRSRTNPLWLGGLFFLVAVAGLALMLLSNRPKPKPPPPPPATPQTFAPATAAVYAEFDPRPLSSSSSAAWPLALALDGVADWPAERERLRTLLGDISTSIVPWAGNRCVVAAGLDNKDNWLAAVAIADAATARTYVDQKLHPADSGTWHEENHNGVTLDMPDTPGHPFYAQLPEFLVMASDHDTLVAALDTWAGKTPSYLASPRWTAIKANFSAQPQLIVSADGPYALAALLRGMNADADAAGSALDSDTFKRFAGGLGAIGVEGYPSADGSLDVHLVLVPNGTSPWWQVLHDSSSPPLPGLFANAPADSMAVLDVAPAAIYNVYQTLNGGNHLMVAPSPSPSPAAADASTPLPDGQEAPAPTPEPSSTPTAAPVPTGTSEVALPPHAGDLLKASGADAALIVQKNPMASADVDTQLADCAANLKSISAQIELYKVDHNGYPRSLTELLPQYTAKLPVCQAGGTYVYTRSDDGTSYRIECHGEAHRGAGLPSNSPSFDSTEGLQADPPALGTWEVLVRQPTALLLHLADKAGVQAALKAYAQDASVATEDVSQSPDVTTYGGWVDVAFNSSDLGVAGTGPSLDLVRQLAGTAAPASVLASRLKELHRTPGTSPTAVLFLDPSRLVGAVVETMTPAPDEVTVDMLKSVRTVWLQVSPQGPNLEVWLTLKK